VRCRNRCFGEAMHARLKPVAQRFNYRVMSLLIDPDQLDDAAPRMSRYRPSP
jgi:hypothetical protein